MVADHLQQEIRFNKAGQMHGIHPCHHGVHHSKIYMAILLRSYMVVLRLSYQHGQ